MLDYEYSQCTRNRSSWGVPIKCENGQLWEGQCHSGGRADCEGHYNTGDCCKGTLEGHPVGPVMTECTWSYGGFGAPLVCGRSDEVLVGRCGGSRTLDCPHGSSHGNLCCKLAFLRI